MRQCSKCKDDCEDSEFRAKCDQCRECRREYSRNYYHEHRTTKQRAEYHHAPIDKFSERASLLLQACLGYPSTQRVEIVQPAPEMEAA